MAERNGSAQGDVPALTLGQLEGRYPAYCKALKILIREGKTLSQIQCNLCWHRLVMIHECMLRQYRDPLLHYGMTKRALASMKRPSAERLVLARSHGRGEGGRRG